MQEQLGQNLADRLLGDLRAFTAGMPQDDDIAILCLTCTASRGDR